MGRRLLSMQKKYRKYSLSSLVYKYEEDQMGCREAVHKVRMVIKVYLVGTKSLT